MTTDAVPRPSRTVNVRLLRAGNRVFLSPAHLEAVFGAGHRPVPCWSGLLAEPLCLERVGVLGPNRREVRARVAAVSTPVSRVALTAQALAALDLRAAAAPSRGPGAALTGPRGTVVLPDGVQAAAPRLLLPEATARRLTLEPGSSYVVELPAGNGPLGPVALECPAGLRDGFLVVDGVLPERLGGAGTALSLRVSAPEA